MAEFYTFNHDLRRTCGRRMYRSEIPIEEISTILGHEDTKTTLKYLGLDHDDLSHAMEKYYQYDQKTVFPKKEILGVSQEMNGRGGLLSNLMTG